MTKGEQLLALGLVTVGAFLVVKYAYKHNTHQPDAPQAAPTRTGVLGSSPVLNPAAPKTTGDFARYDRTVAEDSGLTTGSFTRLDHDTASVDVPAVTDTYSETPYSSPL